MKQIDLTGKCGSCWYYHQIEGTASGECHKFPYGDDVLHDSKHPYFMPTRSRQKCKLYRANPITNADRIRSMSDEELAEIMVGDCPPNYPHGNCREYEKYDGNLDCCKCWLDWLKSPVEADNGD